MQAILIGLKTNIRVFVLSQGVKDNLDKLRESVKLAEVLGKDENKDADTRVV